MGVASGIELGCSYELGSGRTRIRVMTRPRKRSGTVMTQATKSQTLKPLLNGKSAEVNQMANEWYAPPMDPQAKC